MPTIQVIQHNGKFRLAHAGSLAIAENEYGEPFDMGGYDSQNQARDKGLLLNAALKQGAVEVAPVGPEDEPEEMPVFLGKPKSGMAIRKQRVDIESSDETIK